MEKDCLTGQNNTEWLFRSRKTPWKRITEFYYDNQWLLIGVAWITAFLLGVIGFGKYFSAVGEHRSFFDLLYLALQLFTLESGAVTGPSIWELEVARLLAPVVAVYTAIQAVFLLFYQEIQLFRLRFTRDHVVICGLGRKGLLLAKEFSRLGQKVVVVEYYEDNDMLEQCKGRNITVVLGDASDQGILTRTRVHRAKFLFAVCGDDGTNAEVAIRAEQIVEDHVKTDLRCFAHIVDVQLCHLLREHEVRTGKNGCFQLEFFNVYEDGAWAMLSDFPPFGGVNKEDSCEPHLLVVGLGQLGQSVVTKAVEKWYQQTVSKRKRLRITIVDKQAGDKIESLYLQYPYLRNRCEIIPWTMEVHSPEFKGADFLHHAPISVAYICIDDDSQALSAALMLRRHLRAEQAPIIVRMAYSGGLAALLRNNRNGDIKFKNLYAFCLLDRTCKPQVLLHDSSFQRVLGMQKQGFTQSQKVEPRLGSGLHS